MKYLLVHKLNYDSSGLMKRDSFMINKLILNFKIEAI